MLRSRQVAAEPDIFRRFGRDRYGKRIGYVRIVRITYGDLLFLRLRSRDVQVARKSILRLLERDPIAAVVVLPFDHKTCEQLRDAPHVGKVGAGVNGPLLPPARHADRHDGAFDKAERDRAAVRTVVIAVCDRKRTFAGGVPKPRHQKIAFGEHGGRTVRIGDGHFQIRGDLRRAHVRKEHGVAFGVHPQPRIVARAFFQRVAHRDRDLAHVVGDRRNGKARARAARRDHHVVSAAAEQARILVPRDICAVYGERVFFGGKRNAFALRRIGGDDEFCFQPVRCERRVQRARVIGKPHVEAGIIRQNGRTVRRFGFARNAQPAGEKRRTHAQHRRQQPDH